MSMSSWQTMRSYTRDRSITSQRLKPGSVRRIISYARPYRGSLVLFLAATVVDAVLMVAVPLLLKVIIDDGILKKDTALVVGLAGVTAGLALADALLGLAERWLSSRIGEGLIFDLRSQVFAHVQQQALTSTLSAVVSNSVSLALVLVAMFLLSWPVTIISLALAPLFIIPARLIGRRLQRLTRESMQLDAQMGSTMTERFNVAGAMLSKLFGRPREEAEVFAGRAARVRDIGVVTAVYGSSLFVALSLLASLATAAVYGVGGSLVINGSIQLGTLVALTLLLGRMYGPITALSNVQVDVMTALVSFDRVFEVLDLRPLIEDRPGAQPLRLDGPADVEFDHVSFRYPLASEVSLASLESIALKAPERADAGQDVLRDLSFTAPAGQLTALVGPSGAGKTTISNLVARLYDPGTGAVRVSGHDLRDVTQDSLHAAVGVVTQDAHMWHDTIRANLLYARPEATEAELVAACQAAQIWDLIGVLPDGLDTIVGDRGYRLSGGEKQRVALARLLLKAPAVVVLDEATAHLDSESEAAVQQALRTALAGRTSLVIAHRLSTIREAEQILVIDDGRVCERGQHDELLASGGLYADLYRTQFARQEHAGAGLRPGPPEGHPPPHPPPGGHDRGLPWPPWPGPPGPDQRGRP